MLNKLVYQGRFTKRPELKQTQSGVGYCSFTLAWSEKYKEIETKCFLRCKAWRHTAEFITKYFDKGQEIIVEGQLVTEEWETDGQKQAAIVLAVGKTHFCGPKKESADWAGQTIPQPEQSEDDLPF